ncbi:hypothetical protein ccbrp13_32930 [Ktedonobacteria bacterium brp13]|nr:hypothetical protein ccbrp13_32930 [Ktedonobacteria bacterium brp13]
MSKSSNKTGLLSAKKLALLEARLKQRGISTLKEQSIPRRKEAERPLSFAQQRLWFLHQLEPMNTAYLVPASRQLHGRLDAKNLEESLRALIERHESLRTTFRLQEDRPVQVIHSAASFRLPVVDLSVLEPSEREVEGRRLVDQEVQQPYDLEQGSLLRVFLLRLTSETHLLLLTMHHIITDGWSHEIFYRELALFYRSLTNRTSAAPLQPLPIQYADFAAWQRNWLKGEVLDAQLSYWEQQLAGVTPLNLPTDHPRRPIQSSEGANCGLLLPPELYEKLLELSQRADVTLFMLLVAAFQVLLARYSGQTDICIGSPIAGRTRPELEGLIGFFANMLVLRTDFSGNPSFMEILRRVREVTLGAYAHQDLPFEYLVEKLQPERDLSRSPFFQVTFRLHQAIENQVPAPTPVPHSAAELSFRGFEAEYVSTRYDLSMETAETARGLDCRIIYSTDLYEAETIQRMLEHWHILLQGIVANPHMPLSDLPLLSEAELHRLLFEWNAMHNAVLPAAGEGLHTLFEAQAARTPDAVALSYEDQQVTYQRLNAEANRLARYLCRLGVGPEVLVGLCLERSAALLIGLLAILKAGGAYVPLDPTMPVDRLVFMLTDAAISVVVTSQEQMVRSQLREQSEQANLSISFVWVHEVWSSLQKLGAQNLQQKVYQGQAAYIIYTSGSTGTPKGVLIPHDNVIRLFTMTQDWFHFDDRDVWTLFHSYSFDFSVWEIWGALLNGGRLVIVPYWVCRSTEDFYRLLNEERVTILNQTPSAFYQLVSEDEVHGGRDLHSLRQVIFGGEALELANLRPWNERHGDLIPQLVNMYGITETTVHVTYRPLSALDLHGESGSMIGEAIPDLQLYVLDANRQPVPQGVPGELYVGGAGLARGYLNRADLTAQRFIPNPWSREPGARLYRTGDLVRYRSDGEIEFLGRVDQQVKIRGYRIELGEIEAVLNRYTAVRETVAMVREDRPGERQLVAYVVADPHFQATEALSDTWRQEQISQWQLLYDETYQAGANFAADFNIVGWNSSYTGEPIPAEQMQEHVEQTVQRILALHPRRVLEIGCGTGLLLYRLAPHCQSYLATDFSGEAVRLVQQEAQRRGLTQVQVVQQAAHEVGSLSTDGVDVIIIHSVIQYFPSVDYLVEVLSAAARLLSEQGTLFVGDVRSQPLLAAYCASVEAYRAPERTSRWQLQERVRQRMREEEELLVHPLLFLQWGQQIGSVQLQLRQGQAHNEMTRFRYDVQIRKGGQPAPLAGGLALRWPERALGAEELEQLLREQAPRWLRVSEVPNARLRQEMALLDWLEGQGRSETLGAWKQEQREVAEALEEPARWWEIARRCGYDVRLEWSARGGAGCFDVLACRQDVSEANPEQLSALSLWHEVLRHQDQAGDPNWQRYGNDPLQGKHLRVIIPHLRNFAQQRLPDYMVPGAWVLLDRFPLTANGKIDRRLLPAPQQERRLLEEQEELQSRTEEVVVGVWREVLGRERIGRGENFFALGGHSLLATQVVARVRRELDVEIEVRSLFEAPTVGAWAQRIEEAIRQKRGEQMPVLQPVERGAEVPVSFAQQRLWFLDQLEPGNTAYLILRALELQGVVKERALQESIGEIVRRHESLRTTFAVREGVPVQIIHPAGPFCLPLVDLRGLPENTRMREAQRLASQEMQYPCDLASGPLFRVSLLRLDEERHVLLIMMHHIITDGWSNDVFFGELATLYRAFVAEEPSPLSPLPIQYADFAIWQRNWLQGEVLQSHLDYWKQKLTGAVPMLLPTDRPRPAVPGYSGSRHAFILPAELSQRIVAFSRQEGVTLFVTLLATFQTLLYRISGQTDVVVGTDIANRTHVDTEALIGFFVNLLALRSDLSGAPLFRSVLRQVREMVFSAYAHQDIPFEMLVDYMRLERGTNRSPLIQLLLVLQNMPEASQQASVDLLVKPLDGEVTTSKFDLALFMHEGSEGIGGSIVYSTELFEEATIVALIERFESLLQQVIAKPDTSIDVFDIRVAAEKAQRIESKQERRKLHISSLKTARGKEIDIKA